MCVSRLTTYSAGEAAATAAGYCATFHSEKFTCIILLEDVEGGAKLAGRGMQVIGI